MALNGKASCGNCQYYSHEDITDGWICVNVQSDHIGDWTEDEDCCEWYSAPGAIVLE